MGRKCCTYYNGKSCKSGYDTNPEKIRIFKFPKDLVERMRWVNSLPNKLISEITPNIGICLKHWPIGYRTVKVQGSNCKPADPPSIFGLPNSFTPQSSKTIAREIDKRGVSSETRQKTSERLDQKKDTISCWNDLVKYCRSLPVAFQDVKDSIRLVKLDDSLISVEYSLVIANDFQVSANKGSKKIPVRHLLNSLSHKLTQYAQLKNILDYLNKIPFNLASELESSGKEFWSYTTLEILQTLIQSKKSKEIQLQPDDFIAR